MKIRFDTEVQRVMTERVLKDIGRELARRRKRIQKDRLISDMGKAIIVGSINDRLGCVEALLAATQSAFMGKKQ